MEAQFNLRVVYVEFLVDRVTIEQVPFQVLQFSPASYQSNTAAFWHLSSADGTIRPFADGVPRDSVSIKNIKYNKKY
jgi:hypothetical protein